MVNKFIAGLSDLGKKLLIVALAIITIALFDRLLIGPTMSRLSVIDEETVKEEAIIKRDLRFLSYKDRILKEVKAVSPYVTENIPTEDEIIGAFLKKIEIIAAKANVTLVKVTPSTGKQVDNTLKFSADVESSAKLNDIITFMHLINSSDELTKVAKFNLGSKKADTDEVKATMTIVKVIVSKQPLAKPANSASGNTQADASNIKKN